VSLCRTAKGVELRGQPLVLHNGCWWWDVGCPVITEEDAKQLPLKEEIMATIEERIREVTNEIITLPEGADRGFELADLGLDSLDAAELVMELEEEFSDDHLEIDDEAVEQWRTLGDMVDYISERVE